MSLMNMKAKELKDILVSAYPNQKKKIMKMKKTIGDSDPPDYVTLVDMIVKLWNLQESATLEANT
jgi:hypothetical protein